MKKKQCKRAYRLKKYISSYMKTGRSWKKSGKSWCAYGGVCVLQNKRAFNQIILWLKG